MKGSCYSATSPQYNYCLSTNVHIRQYIYHLSNYMNGQKLKILQQHNVNQEIKFDF
jgi:hypothetical protein